MENSVEARSNDFMLLWEQAQVLYKESSLNKKFKNPGDVLRVMLAGKAQGGDPYYALDSLFVDPDGKIVIPGVAAKSILIGNGIIAKINEVVSNEKVTISFLDVESGVDKTFSYTQQDAIRNGLWITKEEAEKDPRAKSSYWYLYPERMMLWKCWYAVVTSLYPHIVRFPIKEAVQEGKAVEVAIAPTQQTTVSDKVAKKSISVVNQVLERQEVEEPIDVAPEDVVDNASKEATSDEDMAANIELNRKNMFKALTKGAMEKMDSKELEKIISKYYPDYKEVIGGSRMTSKKLINFVLQVKEDILNAELGATKNASNPLNDSSERVATIEKVKQSAVEELPEKQEEKKEIEEDLPAKELLENSEKEINHAISDEEPASFGDIVIPPFNERTADGVPSRGLLVAQPLYMSILGAYGNDADNALDDYLMENPLPNITDLSDLLTFGTAEMIESVLVKCFVND